MKRLLAVVGLFGAFHDVMAETYKVKVIDVFGSAEVVPSAMDAKGAVTGGYMPVNGTVQHAFLYMDGVVTDVGPNNADISRSGTGVNKQGAVSGTYRNADDNQPRAFRYVNGKFHKLGTLGGDMAVAAGMNDQGVVVGSGYLPNDTSPRAWMSSGDTVTQIFPHYSYSTAAGVNNAGWVVGTSTDGANLHAFIFRPGVSSTMLPTLGGSESHGFAISEAGHVVGSAFEEGDTVLRPFLYRDHAKMKNLGSLGGDSGEALGLNEDDVVVGWSTRANDTTPRAFVWQKGVMTDLTDSLDPKSGSGWTVSRAIAITPKGHILGVGVHAKFGQQALILSVKTD